MARFSGIESRIGGIFFFVNLVFERFFLGERECFLFFVNFSYFFFFLMETGYRIGVSLLLCELRGRIAELKGWEVDTV